jgi:beta-lactamase regulating signal transducer with metallopeptidase domain
MTKYQDTYRRWTDGFWRRFTEFTGWDPDPDQQIMLLIGAFAALFMAFLLVYLRQITKSSKRTARRHQTVDQYQEMRRYQNAHDR